MNKLLEINAENAYENFKKSYTKFIPFIGEDCKRRTNFLLVGESHYLPSSTKCDTACDKWYAGESKLGEVDEEWTSMNHSITKRIIPDIQDGKSPYEPTLKIWSVPVFLINSVCGFYRGDFKDVFGEVYKNIIAMNFFLRPAKEGQSIKSSLTKDNLDAKVANLNLREIVNEYKPKAVVFLSSLVGEYADCSFLKNLNVPYIITAHPCSAWWNRRSKRRDNIYMSGKEWFEKFVKECKDNGVFC